MFNQNLSYATGYSPFWAKTQEKESEVSHFDSPCDGVSEANKAACIAAQDRNLLLQAQGGTKADLFFSQNQNALAGGMNLVGGVFNMIQASKTGQQVGQQAPPQPAGGGFTEEDIRRAQQEAFDAGKNTGGTPDPAPQSEEDKKQQQFILFGGIGVAVMVVIVVVLMMTGKKK